MSTLQKPIRQGVAGKFLKFEDAGRRQIDDKVSAPFSVLETRKTLQYTGASFPRGTCFQEKPHSLKIHDRCPSLYWLPKNLYFVRYCELLTNDMLQFAQLLFYKQL